jgi:hypothetical protein
MCDYAKQSVYKVQASNLMNYSPEAWYFFKRFTITNEDIETIMGDIFYNPVFVNTENNIPRRRRKAIEKWINKNRHRWEKWIPQSAISLRCRGEQNESYTITGEYEKGVECSGHGICMPDKWIQYSGICKCHRGWTGLVSIDGISPTLDNCSKLILGEEINLQLHDPVVSGLYVQCVIVVPCICAGLFILSVTCYARPFWYHAGVSHSLILCIGTALIALDFYFWIGSPTTTECILRPTVAMFGFSLVNGINIAKLHFVLDEVVNVQHLPEDVILVNNKYIIRDTLKMSCVIIALGVLLFLSRPTPRHYRVEGKIWLKYLECDYDSFGWAICMLMVFYQAFLIGTGLVYGWRIRNARKNPMDLRSSFLYFRESHYMQLTMLGNLIGFYLCWNGFVYNQSPREEEKLVSIANGLTFIGIPGLILNFLPKIIKSILKPRFNSKRMVYTKKITPAELLTRKIGKLTTDIFDTEVLCKKLRKDLKVLEQTSERKRANLTEQVILIKAVIGKQLPTVKRFLNSLQLDTYGYQDSFKEARINMKAIIDNKGNVPSSIKFEHGHFEIFIKGLFRLNRALAYHEAFIARLPQPAVIRSNSDEEGIDEVQIKTTRNISNTLDDIPGSPRARARYLKNINLLYDDDSEEEAAINLGNFSLLPFTKKSKSNYIKRTKIRERVRQEMDIIESQYGRRSPELYISVSITENAIAKAESKVDMKKVKLMLENVHGEQRIEEVPSLKSSQHQTLISQYSDSQEATILETKEYVKNEIIDGQPNGKVTGATKKHELLTYSSSTGENIVQNNDAKLPEELKVQEDEVKTSTYIEQSGRDWFTS